MSLQFVARLTRRTLILSGIALAASLTPAAAADWPQGAVQLVVPAKPGGGTDSAARVVAAKLKSVIGRPVIVVNQPGGGGAVAAETVRNARPDGATLLFYHSGLLSAFHTGGYAHSPAEEFSAPAVMPIGGSYALVAGPDSETAGVPDLVARAKALPDEVTLAVQIRGASHFMAGLLQKDSGAAFRVVDAGSDSDKLIAVQGGQVDAAFVNTAGALQYAEAGKVRILGTLSGEPGRDPMTPDLPSLDEQGYPDVVFGFTFFALAPKGLPEDIAEAINAAFAEVLTDPEIVAQFDKMKMPLGIYGRAEGEARLAEADAGMAATARLLGFK
ncbi:tripartite tricarboxylate transporter substrate binding protein [Salipiger mangrovisoli]|uniref:Tripartite tricarboxylate transporter substrate binding protein n=1 Tax=Salipiger mangrovisoli TaxID=2865933 RepID=A0ABR9X4B8_9RHOB|nr:tripartite tricarboxylate transporter substrate binding protein [Salipiger mangrovisoli]MBE9638354.1 tripartite tricarboxylate transporter substrate binding protein [Salipiger mangrovisoli]